MPQSKPRNESIIPLSREHQYALLLCLRIHRGVLKNAKDSEWVYNQLQKTVRFFDTSLVSHFEAEELVVFPTMLPFPDPAKIVAVLLKEHEELRNLAEELRHRMQEKDTDRIVESLIRFADLLEAHIRKEERQFFPLYQEKISPEKDQQVKEQLLNLIGPASKPKYPHLLE
jgi:hemerythrin-like domain-containing protein